MKSNKVFTIIKKPGSAPEINLTDAEIKAFGAAIEGKRELIPFPPIPGVCVVTDGQAMANNKKPNFTLAEYDDLILGTAVIAAINPETGFVSLTEEQAEKALQYLTANDAGGIKDGIDKRVKTEYLPGSDENSLYSFLSEIKTKYKTVKVKWLSKR